MNDTKKNKKMKIRKAKINDLEAINRIYNYAVISTAATFDTRPETIESRKKWFYRHSGKYPIIVAEDERGVISWASLSQWSDRCAYNNTAEISVYVDKNEQGLGIGNRLISRIIELARKNKLHVVIARIAGENEISVHLHKKYGFTHVGSLKEVGYKFDHYIDVHLMQSILD
jgi:L-amino acid N-acyltransferase YncA